MHNNPKKYVTKVTKFFKILFIFMILLNSLLLDVHASKLDSEQVSTQLTEQKLISDWNNKVMPSIGEPRSVAFLIEFPDYPHMISTADLQNRMFGNGDNTTSKPYDSITNYYFRSSYGKMKINGDVLDWYMAKHESSYYEQFSRYEAREMLLKEAIEYHEQIGHDFSKYDSNNDNIIDGVYIKYSAPRVDNTMWHPVRSNLVDSLYIDGKEMNYFVWSDASEQYNSRVDIHETGHLLGLDDYYDTVPSEGPRGGLGGFTMMDSNDGDLDVFSKFLLGWIEPMVVSEGSQTITLSPSASTPDAVLIMPNATGNPYEEYYLVQNYQCIENDLYTNSCKGNGLVVWHIDARLNDSNTGFIYNNISTEHKLIRVMEADGKEQIELGRPFDSGDFYDESRVFGPNTFPNSDSYDGKFTGVQIDQIVNNEGSVTARFSIQTEDIIAPLLIDSNPKNNEKSQPVDVEVSFNFDGPIYQGVKWDDISVTDQRGYIYPMTKVIYNNKLLLKPKELFKSDSSITVQIPEGAVKDSAGNNTKEVNIGFSTTKNPPNVAWTKLFGEKISNVVDSAVTNEDEYITVANTSGENPGVYITKVNKQGEQVWEKSIESSFAERMVVNNNQIYIVGSKNGFPTIFQINADGEIVSENVYPKQSSMIVDIEKTTDGLVLVYSEYSGNSKIQKLDEYANEVFTKNIVSNSGSEIGIKDVILTTENDFIFASNNIDNSKLYINKYTLDGEIQWETQFSGRLFYQSSQVKQLANGDFIVLGLTTNDNTIYNATLLKLDKSGEIQWETQFSGFDNEQLSLDITNDDGFVISGKKWGANPRQIVMIRTDQDGIRMWEKTIASENGHVDLAKGQIVTDTGYLSTGTTYTSQGRALMLVKLGTESVDDFIPPAIPIVNEVTDKSATLTGDAEAGSTVEVKVGENVLGSAVAKEDGSFIVNIPVQKAGTKLIVTVSDSAGNVSEAAELVVKDVTAPSKPIVNEVTDKSATLTGQAEAGSVVEVKADENVLGSAVAKEDGSFIVNIPVQKAGTKLIVTVSDSAGNASEAVEIVVKDVIAPSKPIVNEVTDKSATLTGDAEAGSVVEVKVGGNVLGSAVAKEDGSFIVNIPVQKAGTKLIVTVSDSAGNVSEAAEIVVKDVTAPGKPIVKEVTDKSETLTGQAEAGSVVEVKVDEKVLGSAVAKEDGSFIVNIPVQKAGTKLIVTVSDSAGNDSDAVEIVVKDETAPGKPIVNEVTEKSGTLTGQAEAGSTVEVKVDEKVLGSAVAKEDGSFIVNIPVQKAGIKLTITVTDEAGNVSDATEITVTGKLLKGWMKIDNTWFYFDPQTGEKVTGWLLDGGIWYFLDLKGAMTTGWKNISNTWYFLDGSGAMKTGWVLSGDKWYYFEKSGAMKTGWMLSGDKWYYFEKSGAMKTGWMLSGDKWYYLEKSGVMITGWKLVGSKWYYFYNNGNMAFNTIIGGYKLDFSGAWIR